MATRAKKTAVPNVAQQQPLNIPVAVRNQPVAAPVANDDPLDLLNQLASQTAQPAEKGNKTRPTWDLDQEEQDLITQWVPASILAEHFEKYSANIKSELEPLLFKHFVSNCFANKKRPDSPTFKLNNENNKPDLQTQFVVQERYKPEASNADEAKKLFISLGVTPENADLLIEKELDFQPETYLRNFKELVKGRKEEGKTIDATDEEKAVAKKVLQFVMTELTPEERKIIVRTEPNLTVKSGFLERVSQYAHTEDQLTAILQVIKPVKFVCRAKFGISDSLGRKNERLQEVANHILGNALAANED